LLVFLGQQSFDNSIPTAVFLLCLVQVVAAQTARFSSLTQLAVIGYNSFSLRAIFVGMINQLIQAMKWWCHNLASQCDSLNGKISAGS
jgi:hypothetical protein